MPIGIMGRTSLAFIDWSSQVLNNKKREGINTFVSAVSLYVAKKLKASINDQEPLTRNTFRYCRVRFCWTTFLETAVYIGKIANDRIDHFTFPWFLIP